MKPAIGLLRFNDCSEPGDFFVSLVKFEDKYDHTWFEFVRFIIWNKEIISIAQY